MHFYKLLAPKTKVSWCQPGGEDSVHIWDCHQTSHCFKHAVPQAISGHLLWAKEWCKRDFQSAVIFVCISLMIFDSCPVPEERDYIFFSPVPSKLVVAFTLCQRWCCHSLNPSFWHPQESSALLILSLLQVTKTESMDGGLVSTSLSFNALIKIVQVSHSENNHLLPVKVNIYTLEVGDEAS